MGNVNSDQVWYAYIEIKDAVYYWSSAYSWVSHIHMANLFDTQKELLIDMKYADDNVTRLPWNIASFDKRPDIDTLLESLEEETK